MTSSVVSNKRLGVADLLICLHLGRDVTDLSAINSGLALWLEIFQRRFSARVVLGMCGFDQITTAALAQWIKSGLIDQSICSGDDDLILNDLIAGAIRSQAKRVCFINIEYLLADMTGAIRFLVENMHGAGGVHINSSARGLYMPIARLEQLMQLEFRGTWEARLRDIHRLCNQGALSDRQAVMTENKFNEPGVRNISQRHCFVTTSGVERLGGFTRFHDLPLRMGGVPVAAFDRYWLLDIAIEETYDPTVVATSGREPAQRILALWASEGADALVVFDLCPAPHTAGSRVDHDLTGSVDVPRQVVIGRRCMVFVGAVMPCGDKTAVFIASNFNKQRYLYSSLYSIVAQSHPHVRVEIVDDLSNDDSVAQIHRFCALLNLPKGLITLRENKVSRGTYWIRNDVTARNLKADTVLFVNDSDDYSTALRATLQLAALQIRKHSLGCFFDIVRVRPTYVPLLLGGEVERYGTASLCYKPQLIRQVGYFQNIRKNADTEFIERVRRFEGKTSLPWLRYPVLYQPFDGGNLTADVYTVQHGENRVDVAKESKRDLHSVMFRRHHEQIKWEELPTRFNFPLSTTTENYAALGSDFLVDGYHATDGCIVVLTTAVEVMELDAWLKCGVYVLYLDSNQNWIFQDGSKAMLTAPRTHPQALLRIIRQNAPHAYLVSRSLLPTPTLDLNGAHAVLAQLVNPWLHRSKAEGDQWAYTKNGKQIGLSRAIKMFSEYERWNTMHSATSFGLMHTSNISKGMPKDESALTPL